MQKYFNSLSKELEVDVSIENEDKFLGQILHMNIDANPLCVNLELSKIFNFSLHKCICKWVHGKAACNLDAFFILLYL